MLIQRWGKVSVDKFTSDKINVKCLTQNSCAQTQKL